MIPVIFKIDNSYCQDQSFSLQKSAVNAERIFHGWTVSLRLTTTQPRITLRLAIWIIVVNCLENCWFLIQPALKVHTADFDDDQELPQVRPLGIFPRKNLSQVLWIFLGVQESLIKRSNVSPSLLYFQRCFPLNKGEEWLKPEYSQEPKVIFAKTKAQAER